MNREEICRWTRNWFDSHRPASREDFDLPQLLADFETMIIGPQENVEVPACRVQHETRPVQVWVDVDLGIAEMVEYLNTIPGVRTQASCQGTIGEGGPAPYRAQVLCEWTIEMLSRLQREFDVEPEGNGLWGYIHPKEATGTNP